jgi:hypothetical protein
VFLLGLAQWVKKRVYLPGAKVGMGFSHPTLAAKIRTRRGFHPTDEDLSVGTPREGPRFR